MIKEIITIIMEVVEMGVMEETAEEPEELTNQC